MTLEDPGFEWGHPLEAIATDDIARRDSRLTADDSGPRRSQRQARSRRDRARRCRSMARPAQSSNCRRIAAKLAVSFPSQRPRARPRFDHEPLDAARWRSLPATLRYCYFASSEFGPKKGRGRTNCVATDMPVIEGLEREWRDALCNKDMEQLRALVHQDFVLIGTRSTGPFMMHRDEWLDAIQRREVDAIDARGPATRRRSTTSWSARSRRDGGSNISAA